MLNKVIKIHISFDDVIFVFKDLERHKYKSIFQQRLLKRLKWFHDRYGCKFTLYVFIEYEGCSLGHLEDRYKEELLKNSDWLKLGYHGYSAEMPDDQFITGYNQFKKLIKGYEKIESHVIRLHRFQATFEEVAFLSQQGVKTLLTADDDRCNYDLSDVENRIVNTEGEYKKNNPLMHYEKTDLRLEDKDWKTKKRRTLKEKQHIVIFSHERFASVRFFSKELFRMREIIRYLTKEYVVEFYN